MDMNFPVVTTSNITLRDVTRKNETQPRRNLLGVGKVQDPGKFREHTEIDWGI